MRDKPSPELMRALETLGKRPVQPPAIPQEPPMSAPGADPLAAIRPVCRECGVTTGGGEFCYQHAPYTVWPLKDGTFRVDRNGRKRVEPVEPPASQWDTRESALRALVADIQDRIEYMHRDTDWYRAQELEYWKRKLERLLESEQ